MCLGPKSKRSSRIMLWSLSKSKTYLAIGEQKSPKHTESSRAPSHQHPKSFRMTNTQGAPTAYWGPWVVGSILLAKCTVKRRWFVYEDPNGWEGFFSVRKLERFGLEVQAGQVNFNMLEDFFGVLKIIRCDGANMGKRFMRIANERPTHQVTDESVTRSS